MITWRAEGTVLSMRRHGETAAIIEVLTRDHGRHAGVVRGGASRKTAPLLQPGAVLDLTWSARLSEHIGSFVVDPIRSRAGVLADPLALAGLNAICALLQFALPERVPYPDLYARSVALLDLLEDEPDWPLAYLRWEVALLETVGYGLDLTRCAVTGTTDDLTYVSPKTGRAVSRSAAGDWADRLLPLPPCLVSDGGASLTELLQGFTTTGHFLTQVLAPALGDKPVPIARQRLLDRIARL